MTHFDRRDLLESKKQVWGGFHNLSDLPSTIREFSRFFRKILTEAQKPKNPSAPISSPKIFFKNYSSTTKLVFLETRILQLHFGIFTSGVLPVDKIL